MFAKIKRLMELEHINQKELAQKLNMTAVDISRFFNGKRKPTIEFVVKVSKLFNISIDWLLNE